MSAASEVVEVAARQGLSLTLSEGSLRWAYDGQEGDQHRDALLAELCQHRPALLQHFASQLIYRAWAEGVRFILEGSGFIPKGEMSAELEADLERNWPAVSADLSRRKAIQDGECQPSESPEDKPGDHPGENPGGCGWPECVCGGDGTVAPCPDHPAMRHEIDLSLLEPIAAIDDVSMTEDEIAQEIERENTGWHGGTA